MLAPFKRKADASPASAAAVEVRDVFALLGRIDRVSVFSHALLTALHSEPTVGCAGMTPEPTRWRSAAQPGGFR